MKRDPFLDERLRVASLPDGPQTVSVKNPTSGAEKQVTVTLFRKAGEVAGARRAVSEIVKWMNYVTGNRVLSLAADLSESVNLARQPLGHIIRAPTSGTRIRAPIRKRANASPAMGSSVRTPRRPGRVRRGVVQWHSARLRR